MGRLNELTATVSIDFSGVTPDLGVPWEIVEMGPRHGEWTLRDPDTGVKASGPTYLEAARRATVFRGMYERVVEAAEEAAERKLRQEGRELARRHVRVSA